MIFPLFFILPLAVLIGLAILARSYWQRGIARWAVKGGVALALAAGGLYLWAIFHSKSSTAAIGILFVPLLMGLAAPVGALLGAMAHQAAHRGTGIWGVASIAGLAVATATVCVAVVHILEFRQMEAESRPEALVQAARDNLAQRDYFVLAAIAENPKAPQSLLLEIALYPDAGLHEKRGGWINSYDDDQLAVMRKVIRNRNAPVAALLKLSESKNEYVLGDIAQEQRTPVEILRRLWSQPHSYLVDWGLAVNPSTPVEILESMPFEKDKSIAQLLARNTSAPAAVLERLGRHTDAIVRSAVAGNLSAPEGVLLELAKDKEEWIARQAQGTLRRPR
ncbi:MAG: hypothetical protein JNK48_00510 [Bryobacterales bacterium]|nr:hypothetical protein [Bryobacterales bacterium]